MTSSSSTPSTHGGTLGSTLGSTSSGVPTITTAELQQLLHDGAVTVVDALPSSYFEVQHLPGALNLAPDEVRTRAAQVLTDRAATVVTYCSGPSCSNSTQVAQQLRVLGYDDLRAYHGGIEHWVAAGLPLEHGASTEG